MKKLGIELKMKQEAGVESIRKHNPDAVVIAAGTRRRALDLPGSGKLPLMDAEDVLKGKGKVGKTVAVVGGGLVGCETAEYLADHGKQVIIVEMMDGLTIGMESVHSLYLPERLGRRGVSILLGAKAVAAVPSGLIFSRGEGKRELLPCDTIVLAVTPKSNRELYNSLQGVVSESYRVGDCVEPRRIADAVLEGFRVGLEI